jgi:hypothetical protein
VQTIAREAVHGQWMETPFGAKNAFGFAWAWEGLATLLMNTLVKACATRHTRSTRPERCPARVVDFLPMNPTPENLRSRGATMQQIFTGSYILLQLGLG